MKSVAAVAGAFALLVGVLGLVLARQRRGYRDAQRVAGFLDLLAPTSPGEAVDPLPFAGLLLLPRRLRRRALLLAVPAGVDAGLVRELAEAGGVLREAARKCASRRWRTRLEGVHTFQVLGGGGDVVPALLSDPNPVVRAEAEQWANAHPQLAGGGAVIRLVQPDAATGQPARRRRSRRKDDRDSTGSAGGA